MASATRPPRRVWHLSARLSATDFERVFDDWDDDTNVSRRSLFYRPSLSSQQAHRLSLTFEEQELQKPPVVDVPVDLFVRFLLAKLVLEVCGAAGAVWGFGEVIGLRHFDNAKSFRSASALMAILFTIRLYWHAKHVWRHGRDFPYVKRRDRRSQWYLGVEEFGAKALLQVCGAAGAVWGASEVLALRNSDNSYAWQVTAWIVGVLFGTRWLLELFSYCLLCPRRRRCHLWYQRLVSDIVPWTEVVCTKFILEVCGAMGAIWGCSEIATLRYDSISRPWRIIALTIGGIFFSRWLTQVYAYAQKRNESYLVTEPPRLAQQHGRYEEHDGEEDWTERDDLIKQEQLTLSSMAMGESEKDEETTTRQVRQNDTQLATNYGSTSLTC